MGSPLRPAMQTSKSNSGMTGPSPERTLLIIQYSQSLEIHPPVMPLCPMPVDTFVVHDRSSCNR